MHENIRGAKLYYLLIRVRIQTDIKLKLFCWTLFYMAVTDGSIFAVIFFTFNVKLLINCKKIEYCWWGEQQVRLTSQKIGGGDRPISRVKEK